jgi:hypothetical protein
MKELLEKLIKETSELILPQALYWCHDKEKIRGVWWYQKSTGNLLSSDDKNVTHGNELVFGSADKIDDPDWVRGRVLEYQGKNWLVIYLQLGDIKRDINQDQLLNIANQLMRRLNLRIDKVASQDGYNLLESKK